jgi:actin-related protein
VLHKNVWSNIFSCVEEAADATSEEEADFNVLDESAAVIANREAWVEVVKARCEVASVSLIYHAVLVYIFYMILI